MSAMKFLDCWIVLIIAQVVRSEPEFAFLGDKNVLLFSIKAGSGLDVAKEFNRATQQGLPSTSEVPALFRSSMLDVSGMAAYFDNSKKLVVELRHAGERLARASFSIELGMNSTNWFTEANLLRVSPRVSTSNLVTEFQKSNQMALIREDGNADCDNYSGFMGVSWAANPPCDWLRWGGPSPQIFFSPNGGKFKDTAKFADQLIIYLEGRKRPVS